jgi:hypothetical protein
VGDSGTKRAAVRLNMAKKADTAATILQEVTDPTM